jgi:flavodoxin
MEINIVYYSGTGGTERVVKCFESTLKHAGYDVSVGRLMQSTKFSYDKVFIGWRTGKDWGKILWKANKGN